MKLNKFFMLGMAGLAFAACSNEENSGNNLAGNGIVEVKIVSPVTRTVGDATTGQDGDDKIEVVPTDGFVYVKLTAESGGKTLSVAPGTTATFYDVKSPTKVEAWVNNGDTQALGTAKITALQAIDPEDFPAYGSTTAITLAGRTEMNDGKTYEMYEATVSMGLPVARLEVSGIKHTHTLPADEESCKYSALTIDGIYLDKISLTDGGEIVDYHMPVVGDEGQEGYIPAPVLWDKIESASFLGGDVWPAVAEPAQCYYYYFYPNATQMPILKIYFANATASDDQNPVSEPRYAVIKSYNGNANFVFEKGKIYLITNVTLDDKNIIGDEEGNTLYGVDVTVEEAAWDVQTISAEWEEQ